MMMGFGFLIMLFMLAFPILVIAGMVVWMMRPTSQPNSPQPPAVPSQVVIPPMVVPPAPPIGTGRVCSHCGAGLQPEWVHCPQCGAPAGRTREA